MKHLNLKTAQREKSVLLKSLLLIQIPLLGKSTGTKPAILNISRASLQEYRVDER